MMDFAEIKRYNPQLVLCPHCGGDGQFEMLTFGDIQTVRTKCTLCGHESDDFYPSKANIVRLIQEWADGSPAHRLDLPTDAPLVLNFGAGVDSTALLVAMVNQGIKPDLILFADVGENGERPETYAFIEFIHNWLISKGFPGITRVTYKPTKAPYSSLEGKCLSNETLPSICFGGSSCTLAFKAAVMDSFLLGVSRGINKRAGWTPAIESLARGIRPVKLIGYDAGPRDSCRAVNITDDDKFRYCYPLRDLKWTREDCITAIRRAGLPVPIKSSCFFCGATQKWEVMWYAATHPELLKRALVMEDTAKNGKHGLGNVKGLWRKESWRAWCENNGIIAPGTYDVIADRDELLQKVRDTKPPLESNLDFSLPVDIAPQSIPQTTDDYYDNGCFASAA